MTDRELMQQAFDAMSYGNAAEREAARLALRERLAQPEHHKLQAKGEHPAPCARHCEATAFQIVIRNLKAQLAQPEQPEQEPSGWKLVPIEPTQEMLRATAPGPVNYPSYCWKAMLYAAPNPPQRKPLTDGAEAVINAARAAMDASTEAQDGKGGIKIASDLAASLSLCLDEYDQAIRAMGKHDQR